MARHREWMIRAFGVALGISAARIAGVSLDFILTPAGVAVRTVFALSLWIGFGVTIAAAEIWIRRTRRHTFAPVSRQLVAAPSAPSRASGARPTLASLPI